jgi:hypothetical protein
MSRIRWRVMGGPALHATCPDELGPRTGFFALLLVPRSTTRATTVSGSTARSERDEVSNAPDDIVSFCCARRACGSEVACGTPALLS